MDDTPLNLKVIRGLLKQTQIAIVTAESGAEALRAAAAQDFDVIFLDHLMLDMDGIETVARLRRETRGGALQTPVICLTANAVSGAKEAYLAAGFTDYLTKPVESAQLEAMLLSFLPESKVRRSGGNGGEAAGRGNADNACTFYRGLCSRRRAAPVDFCTARGETRLRGFVPAAPPKPTSMPCRPAQRPCPRRQASLRPPCKAATGARTR